MPKRDQNPSKAVWMGLFSIKLRFYLKRKKCLPLKWAVSGSLERKHMTWENHWVCSTKKKEIIVLLHDLDIEADRSAHSFVPWIPIEPYLLFSLWYFCNPSELLWLPPSFSVSHWCPPALAQQFSLPVFIFFHPGHSLSPCPRRGLGISAPMHRSQALGCSSELGFKDRDHKGQLAQQGVTGNGKEQKNWYILNLTSFEDLDSFWKLGLTLSSSTFRPLINEWPSRREVA